MPVAANVTISSCVRGLVFVAAGFITLMMVSVSIVGTLRLLRSGQRAKGSVTALYAGPAHPRVEFVAKDGSTVVFPGNGYVSYRVGDAVNVVYAPESPANSAVLEEPGALWMLDASSGMLGVGLCAAGVCLLRKSHMSRRES
jgi:hypothetical protein